MLQHKAAFKKEAAGKKKIPIILISIESTTLRSAITVTDRFCTLFIVHIN
jgi:hypothetical protein